MSEFETTSSIPTTSPLERVEASQGTDTHTRRRKHNPGNSNKKNKKDSQNSTVPKDQLDISGRQSKIERKTENLLDSKIDSKGEIIDITV